MKILVVLDEFFHADGRTNRQTDIKKLIVSFHNFVKVLKIYLKYSVVTMVFETSAYSFRLIFQEICYDFPLMFLNIDAT